MDIQTWISFMVAYAVISVIPGPSVLMVVSQSLARGRHAGLACVLGDIFGGVILMSAAFAGVGAVLAVGSVAFLALKWAGVAWLAWLGLGQIRAARRLGDRLPRPTAGQAGRAGFLTGVLNPKAIAFYLAFLPQFIDQAQPQLPQLAILMASASVVVGIVLGTYAILAARLSRSFASARAQRRFRLASGGCMLGGSVWMAAR